MKIAIKKIDIYNSKLDTREIEKKFSAEKIGELDYQTEFADQLNEIIFEFHVKHELNFDLKINYYFKDDFYKLRNEIKMDSIIYLKEIQKMKEKKKNDVEMKKKKLFNEI